MPCMLSIITWPHSCMSSNNEALNGLRMNWMSCACFTLTTVLLRSLTHVTCKFLSRCTVLHRYTA